MAPLKLLAKLGTRQGSRLSRCLALVAALLLVCGGVAHAGLLFTFTSNSCSSPGCGTPLSFGTVTVTQDVSGNQEIDFTLSLNSPYEIHATSPNDHPAFGVNFASTVAPVTFGNFKIGGVATTNVTTGPSNQSAPNYGTFAYTLSATNTFGGVLTFTASVSTGTLTPSNIVLSTGGPISAYMVSDILQNITGGGTGNVAAVNAPTPEPASLGLFGVALAGLGAVRNLRRRPRR